MKNNEFLKEAVETNIMLFDLNKTIKCWHSAAINDVIAMSICNEKGDTLFLFEIDLSDFNDSEDVYKHIVELLKGINLQNCLLSDCEFAKNNYGNTFRINVYEVVATIQNAMNYFGELATKQLILFIDIGVR